MRCTTSLVLLTCIYVCAAVNNHVDFDQACWIIRNESVARDPSLANNTNSRCASQYALFPNDPALPVTVSLPVCLDRWPGWQMSQVSQLSQWIGPLVGFLLPALVFVLTIPRNYRMPRGEKLFDENLFLSVLWLVAAFGIMILDIISWIIAVFGLAGLMMVGAIDESLKDWMILKEIEREVSKGALGNLRRRQAAYAITLTLIGTFLPRVDANKQPGDDLVDKVIADVCDAKAEDAQGQLHLLLDHQSSYGVQIGAPVVFYLGAYGYALFDASSKLGDNDTAHAIAFGLWYGIVVLTATACCCVLGMTRSATLEAIFGRVQGSKNASRFTLSKSPYHTVALWYRGDCVRSWTMDAIVGPKAPYIPSIERILNSRTIRLVACILTILAITIVCALAISISYFTPIIGFGCRATTVLCYACCQIVLIVCWFCSNFHQGEMRPWIKWPVYILGSVCIAFAVFCSIGGTIMQLLGVYRNCICKAGLGHWINTRGGVVSLATDTADHRDYAHLWIKIGSAGIAYIGVACVVGWGYFMKMKAKCKKQIEALGNLH
ncbi:hypothetical protein DL95DRAFT_443019 [Leptodontidium sp. 2 PMI_412]|nr:hypothetical protein DL95DRAFT_443019 [Leptodontidium sp. 2 PMI_412]